MSLYGPSAAYGLAWGASTGVTTACGSGAWPMARLIGSYLSPKFPDLVMVPPVEALVMFALLLLAPLWMGDPDMGDRGMATP